MIGRLRRIAVLALLVPAASSLSGRHPATTCSPIRSSRPAVQRSRWSADGTLLEACSCNVPCPCNFGQGPSQSYCHTVYAYRLKTGRYGGVALDGLVFGGGEAEKGVMGFLDSRATAEQKPALEKLALAVF